MAVIKHPVDFLGINYYEPEYRRSLPGAPFGTEGIVPIGVQRTDSGAVIDPDGLYRQLIELRDYYAKPKIYITENGAAFDDRPDNLSRIDDIRRIAFLRDHLMAAHRALSEGVNLAGYFVWSLIDNFEWRSGFKVRYGLVYLDPCSGWRVRKSSFDWYSKIARGSPVSQMAGGRS